MRPEYISVDAVRPAEYNPRIIDDRSVEVLMESIDKLGFILPILVNANNNVIVAGHQRTMMAKRMGIKRIPCFFISDMTISDEINFNQIHNGSEHVSGSPSTVIGDHVKRSYIELSPECVCFNKEKINMAVVDIICRMILRYGNVFMVIICNGQIIYQNEYAYACKLLNMCINAYICDDEMEDDVKKYFRQDYGKFSYDHIKKQTFVQGLAQLDRNVDRQFKKNRHRSVLYEDFVYKHLEDNDIKTILDFGCGKGAYINHLGRQGYDTCGVEFYNNNTKSINVRKGNKQIDNLIDHINRHGSFDLVICDSVLNSIDSMKAQTCIMDCLNLFSSKHAFISGRLISAVTSLNYASRKSRLNNKIKFLDKDNFTANFRSGNWYYQKFHDKDEVYRMASESGFRVANYKEDSGTFKCLLEKINVLPNERYIAAVSYEFNLPLPDGTTYNRHKDVLNALGLE